MSRVAIRSACAPVVLSLLLTLTFSPYGANAQPFVDSDFRPYSVSSDPAQIESSLRRFLSDRMNTGEAIEIVPDARGRKILVRGSDEVHRLVAQFVQAIDHQQAEAPKPAERNLHGYGTKSIEELGTRLAQLRGAYKNRPDVRILVDERTLQVLVQAPDDVHQQIKANWNGATRNTQAPASNPNPGPWQTAEKQVQLQNVSWRDVLRGVQNAKGQNVAVGATDGSPLEVSLTSKSGETTRMQIDQQNNALRLTGTASGTEQWSKVVEALDRQPIPRGELQTMGVLGDARPESITKTIALIGATGGSSPRTAKWGGEVVSRLFGPDTQRQPIQLAQAPAGALQPEGQEGFPREGFEVAPPDDGGGSFLGPVRIEFIEGTDIFIVRGAQRDVDRVMAIIKEIQDKSVGTAPEIEIVPLRFTNDEAVASLIRQLNSTVLEARQGDVSVTPLGRPNALLLIGRKSGVDAVKLIVEKLDIEGPKAGQFRVIKLEKLPAVDAERTLNTLYGQQGVQGQQDENVAVAGLATRVRIVADYRSNSIVAFGSPRDIDEVENLLRDIDVETSAAKSEIKVFALKNALALEVKELLDETLRADPQNQQTGGQGGGQGGFGGGGAGGNQATLPYSSPRATMLEMLVFDKENKELLESGVLSNVYVGANERTNSLVVTAPTGSMELLSELIRQLDELPPQEAEIKVFTVINGDASSLIEMLDTLFQQATQQGGPLVQSATGTGESTLVPLRFALDIRTNSIIASGNGADLKVVESILLFLDASDVSRRRTTVYELLNQPADAVADAIAAFVQQKRDALLNIAPENLTPFELLEQEVVAVAELNSNKLIISATEQYYEEVMDLIKELDKRPEMVMVQALIAEVNLNNTEELGVELGIQDSLLFSRSLFNADGSANPGFNFNNASLGQNASGDIEHTAGQALSDFALGRVNSELGYGGLVLSASSESVSILLRALQEARRLDILSRPQVMMLNNQLGLVSQGAQVPFVTGVQNNGFTTTNIVEFRQVGLSLTVRPRISPDGLVVMQVQTTKSEIGPISEGIPIQVGQNGEVIRQPSINETTANTVVSARDGQTVILGGLITKSRSAFERKVPYLGDLPFFGRLFRSDGVAEERTELLIILTPKIIRDQSDLDRVNNEEYSRMSWCLGNVIETHGDIMSSGSDFDPMSGGEVMYSDFVPSNANEAYPATSSPTRNGGQYSTPTPTMDAVPTPTPATQNWSPAPATLSPPSPDALPDLAPQAKAPTPAPRVSLRPPNNQASIFPGSTTTSQRLPQLDVYPNARGVKPVDYIRQTTDPSARRAIYRFDEVPER